ncbi:hypothetical protein Patl1_34763 [Pistacia atlantica]|uniref:Uncharacterized protein n=1 Tax=Pistacia atlantica TaxID=434234 RepID=A0ACC0ZT28_9ROSI|nr:hypothetical protein Patl1_34763 [Pistacia atlantica]
MFLYRMDEMMRGQRGWRELAVLGDKMDKFSGMIEGLIWSPRSSEVKDHFDDWTSEEVSYCREHTSNFMWQWHSFSTFWVLILIFMDQIAEAQLVLQSFETSNLLLQMLAILVACYQGRVRYFVWHLYETMRGVVGRTRGMLAYNLSKDHKPDLEVERDRILKAGGFIQVGRVNGSLNLARAIGDVEFKLNKALPAEKQIVTANPDITTIELCDDDEFLVLACDGIWDCLSSQQLVDYVRDQLATETKLSTICERVFEKCLAPVAGGEGCDNMTMILVQFKKPFNAGASVAEQPSACDQPSSRDALSSCDQPSEPEISTAETKSQSEPERNPAETESK